MSTSPKVREYDWSQLDRDKYLAYEGKSPKRIPHWEHWSNPDAETYITGIDYYDHPRLCRLKWNELYPFMPMWVPDTDAPKPRPKLGLDGQSSNSDAHSVRWGDGETATFEHGEKYFKIPEQVFAFSPLEKGDFTDWKHVVMNWDFSSEEVIYQRLRKNYPAEWGDKCPDKENTCGTWFYNTMFMWPMLTFGWELFLECCMDDEFERVMDEFAEINRRVFRAMARLPINYVICHDDIVTTRGPVCSPTWMKKYIFPRYEEYWGYLKAAGIKPIFMVDGCIDQYVDDVMACGSLGFISEPYTDYRAIARKHKDVFIAGEGDNRILSRNDPQEIDAMVDRMIETSKMSGGYTMCVGNHIPWNIPGEAVKRYLDRSAELAWR